MRISFDTNYRNNKYEIKISIGEGFAASSTTISISSNDTYIRDNDQIDHALQKVLDNTRFTVKERQAAEEEIIRFLGYIKNNINAINPNTEIVKIDTEMIQDIFETAEDKNKIDDEEILNEQ